MKPVEFPEQNTVIAKDQPQYQPLPALTDGQEVISCWELSDEEMQHLMKTKKIYLSCMTFGQPLQPLYMSARKSELMNVDDETQTETEIKSQPEAQKPMQPRNVPYKGNKVG